MTRLTKPVRRVTSATLDGSFGPDRNRRLVVTIVPGDGRDKPDMFELKPAGLWAKGRTVRIAIVDAYHYAIRAAANLAALKKARETKKAKALQRQARQIRATERRLFSNGSMR